MFNLNMTGLILQGRYFDELRKSLICLTCVQYVGMSQREAKVLQTFSAGFEGIMLLEAVFKAEQIPKDFIFF